MLWRQVHPPQNDSRPLVPFHWHFINQRAQPLRNCPGMLLRKRSQLLLRRRDCPKGLVWARLRGRLIIPVQDEVVISRFAVGRYLVEGGKNDGEVLGSGQDDIGGVSYLELLLEVVSG